MKSHVVRKSDTKVIETDWGSIQWMACGANGTSGKMTVGRVTFKPGKSNPAHLHPNCDEILYVVSGTIEHTLPEGGTVTLGPGDCIVLPEGGKHQAKNIGKEEAVVVVSFSSPDRRTEGEI